MPKGLLLTWKAKLGRRSRQGFSPIAKTDRRLLKVRAVGIAGIVGIGYGQLNICAICMRECRICVIELWLTDERRAWSLPTYTR